MTTENKMRSAGIGGLFSLLIDAGMLLLGAFLVDSGSAMGWALMLAPVTYYASKLDKK